MNPINPNDQLAQFLTHTMRDDNLRLSQHEIEALYTDAHEYYQNADYENAVKAFTHLSQLSPNERRFHMGLGSALQSLELYTEAIRAYMVASTLDLTDSEATLNIGYCLIQIQQYEEAENVLNLVLEETRHHEDKQAFYHRAQTLIAQIQKILLTED